MTYDWSLAGSSAATGQGLLAPGNEEATSLSDQAYNHILDLILTARIRPGEALQERKLAEMLSMSRTPLREALSRLEAERFVVRSYGRTPVVSPLGIENFIFFLDMRRVLEVEAAGRATGHIPAESAGRARVAINALQTAPAPTSTQHWAVDDLVHGTIAEAAGNPVMASSIRDLRRRTRLFNTARIPKRLMLGASEHLALLNAVIGSDPQLSRQMMGQHLDNVRDAIVEFLLGSMRS